MASIFEFDENGEIIYEPSEVEADGSAAPEDALQYPDAADPGANGAESEDLSGTNTGENVDSGTDLSDSIQTEEILEKTQEIEQIVHDGDTYNVSLLSDEVQELLVNALSPASGTLGSSTLDYFDRVVSGLPSDYKYIGYRTNSDNSYDGVLYFGDDYEVDDNVITFGKDTVQLRVYRTTSGYNNTVTRYEESELDGASIGFDLDGEIVYYTNAQVGYPVMGGVVQPFNYSPLIAVGLLCIMALAVMQKIFLKR